MDPMQLPPQQPGGVGPAGQPPMVQDSQSQLAAMMWQMQMAAPQNPAMMMPPWFAGGTPMPMLPLLLVRVEGVKFDYQLTEDDVRKVFARYGTVTQVNVEREGTSATVQFEHVQQAVMAKHDLHRKHLAGMSGAYLCVEFAPQPAFDPTAQLAAAAAAQNLAPHMLPQMPGYAPQGVPSAPNAVAPAMGGNVTNNRPRKYTCKLEVGIENENEFRVGSRVIQIARKIWQDPKFQEHGGKTRLRGKGVGGPHEAEEPLALCISCQDQASFEKAVQVAESELQKVHEDYKAFCQAKGCEVPDLSVKVSKRSSGVTGPRSNQQSGGSDADPPRGERPATAPTDEEIERMIEERNEARKSADFKRSDEIRDYLKQRGVVLMDEKGAKGNFKGNEVTKWRFWRP